MYYRLIDGQTGNTIKDYDDKIQAKKEMEEGDFIVPISEECQNVNECSQKIERLESMLRVIHQDVCKLKGYLEKR